MKSIRDIYKVGKGPSSSHTMGPERAAHLFLSQHPDADGFQVILYGSLSKTGIGHGTDRVLRQVLSPYPTEIIFSKEELADSHPNTLDFISLKNGRQAGFLRVESIGGGDIRVPGQAHLDPPEVYPENSFAEIADFCKWRYIDKLSDYVELNEGEDIWDFLMDVWQTMKQSIADGLIATGVAQGKISIRTNAGRECPCPAGVPEDRSLRLCRSRAECRQRHHRHRPNLRCLRRSACSAEICPGYPGIYR